MFRRGIIAVAGTIALSTALFVGGWGALSAAGSTPLPAAAPTKNISITATCSSTLFCFAPMDRAVATGTKVVWTNNSFAPHELALCTTVACGVTSGTGTDTGFGSAVISGGDSYAFTFHGLGTYTYYCTIHGYATMHGTITVDALPTVTNVKPSTLARGSTSVAVMVSGTGFRPGVKARVPGTGVTVTSVMRVNAKHLTLMIDVAPTAPMGMRKVTITNPDGGSVTKTRAVNVT